ncbi:hypothetical protein AGMMS49991_03800 [Spirochaetia bacterium]|nr:hypothetical protein AGMMS49991_03800 [Spirochaetia bacterium]
MGVNNKYKDSLFSWLFSDPDTLRELYSAIEGVPVDPALPVIINTLEGVLFMERIKTTYPLRLPVNWSFSGYSKPATNNRGRPTVIDSRTAPVIFTFPSGFYPAEGKCSWS